MSDSGFGQVYGPVLSRRLGRSLGVDLVPYKVCTYDCVYCQIGATTNKTIDRKEYIPVMSVLDELREKLGMNEKIDYITLAGSGEPTLNGAIGELIHGVKAMTDIPLAVLTNGSLLWMSDVRDALMDADIVMPSLDVGDDRLFQYVNRPYETLSFDQVVEGIIDFSGGYKGEIWLEVLLLAGVTGISAEVRKIAKIVEKIKPTITHLNTVCRPPSEGFASPLPQDQLEALKELFPGKVEIIAEKESGDIVTINQFRNRDGDILALLSRRPCTASEVASGLGIHATEVMKYLENLVSTKKIRRVFSSGRYFYALSYSKKESTEA